MNLQEIVIKRYFDHFPKQSLREISQNTNIQITRVFRLLNGSPMKLSEYESFENAIHKKELHITSSDQFLSLSKQCLRYLSEAKIAELMHEMNQSLKMRQFIDSKQSQFNTNQFA